MPGEPAETLVYEGPDGGYRVLVVEDDPTVLDLLKRVLLTEFRVAAAVHAEEALPLLIQEAPEVLVVDKNLPEMSGLELLARAKEIDAGMQVIIITAYASMESAVDALRLGAYDYLAKPFQSIEVVREKVRRACQTIEAGRERDRMRDKLAQTDRMATVGRLAAGIAHEINNPLAFVMYNLESLAEDLAKVEGVLSMQRRDELIERAREAAGGARRIRDVVRRLKTFSRLEEGLQVPVQINWVIDSAIDMAFNEIRLRTRLVKDFSYVPPVLGSEGRLSQVFLNILIHAALTIEEGDVENNVITIRTRSEAGSVVVEIEDTGKGIAPEHLDHIFDPFYTAGQVYKGSGLAMAMCHGIVHAHGGDIEVTSQEGKGGRFVVRLPAMSEEEDGRADVEGTREPTQRGRVLMVDDEPMILAMLKRSFRDDYEVTTADSGTEARTILEQDTAFDAVLCDLMMPDVSGMELHTWLEGRAPELARRVVFITGGAFTPKAQAFLDRVPNLRVEKPFDPNDLKALVHRLLGPTAGG